MRFFSCLTQRYENDILQGVEYFRSCQCKPEYNKTCTGSFNGTTLTPDLYVGLSADYCEISSSSEGTVTSTKTYKKCQCPDNFITCPDGTKAPDAPADNEFCVDVSASGTVTTKYLDGTCQCVPVAPGDGYTAANLQDPSATNRNGATISASKLSASNQAALKQIFLQYCKHQNNGLVKSDGCGNLFFKCAINPETYSYTADNCEAPKTLQGTPSTQTGWNGSLTLYPTCDCDASVYKYTSDSECINFYTASGGASSSNHKLFCTAADNSSTPYSARVTCGTMIFKIDSSKGCTFSDGSGTKYSACTCRQGGESISGNACVSAFCGLPSKGGDDYACWANDKRISVYNGGGAANDATCVCPKAQLSRDLDGCGGQVAGETVTTCRYH